jgi:hypothetical protein
VAAFYGQDGRYAENAGAIFGACIDVRYPEKRSLLRLKWTACMPEMQEQFPASAGMRTIPNNEDSLAALGTPKMQEHFSARASTSGIPKNEVLFRPR